MNGGQVRVFVACVLIALMDAILFCASTLALLRVLRAAARDAYTSPRRRLLALDDGVARQRPNRVMAILNACRPWTTQKTLLAMVAYAACLRIAWAFVAIRAWNPYEGTIGPLEDTTLRGAFYGFDAFQAAGSLNLYTNVARFWADLAHAARQGTGASRPIGGGDEYRARGTTPWSWKITRPLQRVSSFIAFAAAGIATLLQVTAWGNNMKYLNEWTAVIEAGAYIVVAIVMVSAAHHAVVELRLVPIELPTRRRRVFRVAAVTGSVATCLLVRAVVLVVVAEREIYVTSDWDVVGIVGYFGLLETMPLGIVLAYNRMAPLSASTFSGGRARGGFGRGRRSSEEEPLIAGAGNRGRLDDDNPFATTGPYVHP